MAAFQIAKISSQVFVFLFSKLTSFFNSFSFKAIKYANGYSVCNGGIVEKNIEKLQHLLLLAESKTNTEIKSAVIRKIADVAALRYLIVRNGLCIRLQFIE